LDLVRTTLNFVVIVWFSQARGCLLEGSIFPLLFNVVEFLLQQGSPSLGSNILGDAVLTAFSAARKDPSLTDENRESIWQLAITSVPSELSIACKSWRLYLAFGVLKKPFQSASFADYIITSECLCNSLYCAEAWRYLGEVLLLILKRHYIEEQEPLALLACPTVCGAMLRLLQADTASSEIDS
jgi:hypothetical protein